MNNYLANANWDNLLELYDRIHTVCPVIEKAKVPIPSYYSANYAWPRYSLIDSGVDINIELLQQIEKAIVGREISPFILLAPVHDDNPEIEDLWHSLCVRLVSRWPMISYDCGAKGIPSVKTMGLLKLRIVDSDALMSSWYGIVSDTLFSGQEIPGDAFASSEFSLIIAHNDDSAVGTAMIFWGREFPSVHMVAVKPEYRNRGFGQRIFTEAIDTCKSQKRDIVFAQASAMGTKPWLDLGFEIDGYMNNYWKIGVMP